MNTQVREKCLSALILHEELALTHTQPHGPLRKREMAELLSHYSLECYFIECTQRHFHFLSRPTMSGTTAASSTASANAPPQEKVKVHFVAVGSAPILKKTKFQISATQPFAAVTTFLRKMLKLEKASLFLYVQSAFVPGPEEIIGDVQRSFGGGREELVIHYSLQEAWG